MTKQARAKYNKADLLKLFPTEQKNRFSWAAGDIEIVQTKSKSAAGASDTRRKKEM